MENSILYDALGASLLQKWKDEQEKDNFFTQTEIERKEELKTELSEKSRDLLESYSTAIEDRMDYLHYNLSIKILNLGIQIGMELEKAFHGSEE